MATQTLQLSVSLSIEETKNQLRIEDSEQVQNLLEVAHPLISAQAVYEISDIDEKLEDAVVIDGIRFNSQVLRKNLDKVGKVFPHIVTIGARLEERAKNGTDLLEQYYLDMIGNIALIKARKDLEKHLSSVFAFTHLSYMSPGSLQDWPLQEQGPLFSLFKGAEASIRVRLTESLLMIPRKTVSGIFFPSEVTFYNCQICPREKCEVRMARYNEDLVKEYKLQR